MKNSMFLLIIIVLFSACEASTDLQPSYQIAQIGSPGKQNSYQIIPAGSNFNNRVDSDDYYDGGYLRGTTEQKRNSDNRRVLVTYDITNKLQQLRSSVDEIEDLYSLKFSLSGRFNLILPMMNNGPKIGTEGEFIDRSQNTKTINFDTTDIGRLRTIIPNAPHDKPAFIIVFQKQGEVLLLGFKKSSYADSYILSSVDYGTERYIIRYQNGLPHLCIYMNQSVLPNIQATPLSTLEKLHKRHKYYSWSDDGFYHVILSEKIIGQGYVSKKGAISYILSQNPTVNYQLLDNLIDIYIEEAAFEGINHDIAIAQMLYATNYLRNKMLSHNYAGLSTSETMWDGRFPNLRTGVRAHIQHLKGYGSVQPPRNQIVDPRYYLLGNMQGKVKNLSQLCELWSHYNSYKNNIIRKLYGMYQYTDE